MCQAVLALSGDLKRDVAIVYAGLVDFLGGYILLRRAL